MKFDNQLRYAVQIIHDYSGDIPLHAWLKNFFRDHPQMGSNDRKQVSALVYSYYRLGHALRNIRLEERLFIGNFLVSKSDNPILSYFKPEWGPLMKESLQKKLDYLLSHGIFIHLNEIFPWKEEISPSIEYDSFCKSFLVQPDLFIRIRQGYEELVKSKLSGHKISFEAMRGSALRLSNSSPVDKILDLDKEAVIQDYSSQRAGDFLPDPENFRGGAKAWDCCAASGGKSILLHDLIPGISITVSDIRKSILINLEKRFARAGIKKYKSFTADLRKPLPNIHQLKNPFDVVLLDAPCSGSGTWSRNPDELYFFDPKEIRYFRNLQEQIFSRVIVKIKPKGYFVYITCSVFHEENEGMVQYILENSALQLIQSNLVKGYMDKADTLFVASFRA